MTRITQWALAGVALAAAIGCGGKNDATGASSAASSGSSSSSGAGGGGGAGGSGGSAPVNMCSAAIAMILKPVDQVSTGAVSIVKTAGATRTVYVDASAGGFGNQDSHPRVYVNLDTATRVDITDKQAPASTAWDLAFKRPVLFSNDGDGGSGKGVVIVVAKAFDQVSAADANGPFATESFVDMDCNPKMDPTGDVLTTMSSWYDYDQQTNQVTPKANTTYVIRGATGKLYKLAIQSFYGKPDGTTGTQGGYYLLQLGGL